MTVWPVLCLPSHPAPVRAAFTVLYVYNCNHKTRQMMPFKWPLQQPTEEMLARRRVLSVSY